MVGIGRLRTFEHWCTSSDGHFASICCKSDISAVFDGCMVSADDVTYSLFIEFIKTTVAYSNHVSCIEEPTMKSFVVLMHPYKLTMVSNLYGVVAACFEWRCRSNHEGETATATGCIRCNTLLVEVGDHTVGHIAGNDHGSYDPCDIDVGLTSCAKGLDISVLAGFGSAIDRDPCGKGT